MDQSSDHIDTNKSTPFQIRTEKSIINGSRNTIYWVDKVNKTKLSSEPLDQTDEGRNLRAKPEYKHGTKYTGDWVNNEKHGFGSQTWAKGHKYEGGWANNERHGSGTFWVMRNRKLNKQYSGDWAYGKRCGSGVAYYQDKSRYEGRWENNQRHGRGRMDYADGSIYDGEWFEDKRSGVGVLSVHDGNRYEGHWSEDKKEGPGRYYYFTTNKLYEGEWLNDVAKCGTFSDIEDGASDNTRHHYVLPKLELADPDSVLGNEIARIRQGRSLQYGTEQDDELVVFEDHELATIRRQFYNFADGDSGLIQCKDITSVMNAANMNPNADEIQDLLTQLRVTSDTEISFAELIDIMALTLQRD